MSKEEDKRNIFKLTTQDGNVVVFDQNPPQVENPGTFTYQDPSTEKIVVIEVAGGAKERKLK